MDTRVATMGDSDAARGRAGWGTVCIKPPGNWESRERGEGRGEKRLYTES